MNKPTRNRTMLGGGTLVALAALLAVSIGAGGAAGDEPPATSAATVPTVPAAPPARPAALIPVQEAPESPTTVAPPTFVPDRIVLVGDSLADESSRIIDFVTPDQPVVRKFWGGTAPCDWLDEDLEATPTSVVVITFTGNNGTPCMLDEAGARLTGDRLVDTYRADVSVLVDRARAAGAWVVLVGQANHHPRLGVEGQIAGLNAAYREIAQRLPMVAFVDAGAAVEAVDGSYTDRLPCTELDMDCAADGTTVVRGDGVHFCPVVAVNPCPVWSSGAVRFGTTIAAAATDPERLD